MDLSYKIDRENSVAVLAPELAVLLVGVAARQAASPTAQVQARLTGSAGPRHRFHPVLGAFDAAVAAALRHWANR